jgi:hypothetical protein
MKLVEDEIQKQSVAAHIFLIGMTIINGFSILALGELNRFHLMLKFQGITTLDYLKKMEKVNKQSKINVKIQKVDALKTA